MVDATLAHYLDGAVGAANHRGHTLARRRKLVDRQHLVPSPGSEGIVYIKDSPSDFSSLPEGICNAIRSCHLHFQRLRRQSITEGAPTQGQSPYELCLASAMHTGEGIRTPCQPRPAQELARLGFPPAQEVMVSTWISTTTPISLEPYLKGAVLINHHRVRDLTHRDAPDSSHSIPSHRAVCGGVVPSKTEHS